MWPWVTFMDTEDRSLKCLEHSDANIINYPTIINIIEWEICLTNVF